MKILIESKNGLWGGGVETFLQSLANELCARGHAVTVVAKLHHLRDARPWLAPGIRCIRRELFRKPYKKTSLPGLYDRIPKRIYESFTNAFLDLQHFDLVIALLEGRAMKRAARDRAGRRVAWIHTDYLGPVHHHEFIYSFSSSEEEFNCMRRFERIICVSQTVKDSIVETVGDPGNLCVRYLPIDVKGIREKAQEPCELTRPKDRPLLISVSRLSEEKQTGMLLEACEILHKFLDFELWIVGDGRKRPQLEAYIDSHRLSFARLLGGRENPFPLLRQADLFVSASMSESYGLAVQEALVLGVPVVAVACQGIRESLDSRFGLLVDNEAPALAEGLRVMLQTPGLLAAYRAAIDQDYPADRLYDDRMQAILELLERAPSADANEQGG